MPTTSMNTLNCLVRNVRRAVLLGEPATLPDGRLVESFLTYRDENAFAMLVKRHGPMVLGVCRRVIGNEHDAEDACQAVFIVLARKAGSIVPRDLVGNWLYGVAYRIAMHARGRLGRHRARERQVNNVPEPMVAPEVDVHELHQILDRELNQLPEKFRVPMVLCDLEGRPRKDVAVQLKIPEGTLSSRLAKGRDLLAHRLARHGLTLCGGALANVIANQASAVQPALVVSTVKAAALVAGGQSAVGIVSAHVIALSEGALKTMFLQKLKMISMLIVGVLLGGLGLSVAGTPGNGPFSTARAAAPVHPVQANSAKPASGDDLEPLDGDLLLHSDVQKELRLNKNQVSRLQAVSENVDAKNGPVHKQIEELQKQIDELHKRIGELNNGMADKRSQIEKQRGQDLAKAAPEILSAQALKRLRQIQRQQRGLDEFLQDAKIQRLFKLDDEQLKKIETILKTESGMRIIGEDVGVSAAHGLRLTFEKSRLTMPEMPAVYYYSMLVNSALSEKSLQKLFDVLTPAQQRSLLNWVGEPYQSTSWQKLRGTSR
jgi:RNA polymerase sigma factor (sigma-70 family)